MLLIVAALFFLSSGPSNTATSTAPPRVCVVVLRDGTRYVLAKPHEIRGSQARLSLPNGSLVAIRASEIDEQATRLATTARGAAPAPPPAKALPVNPLEGTVAPSTAPKELGVTRPPPGSAGSIGSRVKLDREKADTLFLQDAVPTPRPAARPATKPGAEEKDPVAAMLAESYAAEESWRAREAHRRARLAAARENDRDVCARYHAAAASAGTQDGYLSDAAGAILGALLADCQKASRDADAIEGERAMIEEDCRKTQGCQPGWLR